MSKDKTKTNAMRILERLGIPFDHQEYECGEFTDGSDVADRLGLAHEEVFKTLVTLGADREHYVFVIPVDAELDLKKCARAVGVKSVQMIHVSGGRIGCQIRLSPDDLGRACGGDYAPLTADQP